MEYYVWWTDQAACMGASEMINESFPEYLREQLNSRYGRPGRGRLWAAAFLGEVSIDPWPTTELARILETSYAGIVFKKSDYSFVKELPGIITDLNLEQIHGNS